MKLLDGIQAIPIQNLNTSLDNGEIINISLIFRPAVQMWFIDISYIDFEVKGLRLCSSPNLLQQFENIIPFGLNVNVIDNTEPFLINDLSTERVEIGILTQAEVDQINESYREAKI